MLLAARRRFSSHAMLLAARQRRAAHSIRWTARRAFDTDMILPISFMPVLMPDYVCLFAYSLSPCCLLVSC